MLKVIWSVSLWLACAPGAAEIVKRELRDAALVGDYYVESDQRDCRPMLLLGGSEGGIAWHGSDQIAEFVGTGYGVLALAYFGAPGLPASLQRVPLEYFDHAVDWLLRESDCAAHRVAVVGGSKGAEAALLLASRNADVGLVVVLSPSAYVFWGIRRDAGSAEVHSSWSENGRDVPFAPFIDNETRRRALANYRAMEFIDVYRDALRDAETRERASIAVERMRAPVLLVSGSEDRLWPSAEMAQAIVERLARHAYPFTVENVVVNHGHGVGARSDVLRKVLDFVTTHRNEL
jgi:pimeloyl-ACP methyl ester carboxylesterase